MSGTVIRAGEPHTIRTRGITLLRSGHKEVRRLKRANHTPSIHGNKVWNSSYLIMDHLTKRKLSADEHLMDIGCGWGGLALYLARHYQVCVTGLTPSVEQLRVAKQRAENLGLQDQVEFQFQE